MSAKTITIFGTSRVKPGDEIYELAKSLGGLLGGAGFNIANGGYGGTMQAAAEGASKHNAKIFGVTCRAFKRGRANEFVTDENSTNSLPERLNKLIELGDGYIVLPGGTGTLLELAEVWELKNKHFIDENKPLVLVGDFWKGVVDIIAVDDPGSLGYIKFAETVEQAVEILIKELGK